MKKSKTRSKQTKSPTQPVKVTEVSVMVSKKVSANFNSCCVSYSVKASLDESNNEYLKALDDLKAELVVKVQEALAPHKQKIHAEAAAAAPAETPEATETTELNPD